jgi:hypothetical protein
MDAPKGFIDLLVNMGLPGLVIFALSFAVLKLFTLLMASHEARFIEGRAITEAMGNNAKSMDNLADVVEKRSAR